MPRRPRLPRPTRARRRWMADIDTGYIADRFRNDASNPVVSMMREQALGHLQQDAYKLAHASIEILGANMPIMDRVQLVIGVASQLLAATVFNIYAMRSGDRDFEGARALVEG